MIQGNVTHSAFSHPPIRRSVAPGGKVVITFDIPRSSREPLSNAAIATIPQMISTVGPFLGRRYQGIVVSGYVYCEAAYCLTPYPYPHPSSSPSPQSYRERPRGGEGPHQIGSGGGRFVPRRRHRRRLKTFSHFKIYKYIDIICILCTVMLIEMPRFQYIYYSSTIIRAI